MLINTEIGEGKPIDQAVWEADNAMKDLSSYSQFLKSFGYRWKSVAPFLLLFAFSLNASEVYEKVESAKNPEKMLPWFTGPLLAPSSGVIPLGSVNFEPYLYLTGSGEDYNSKWETVSVPFFWSCSFQFPLQFGVAPRVSFAMTPTVNCKQTEGQSTWAFADFQMGFDVQLCYETDRLPGIKFSLRETFPNGQYDRLNRNKLGTDVSGTGSYRSLIGLNIGKLIQIRGIQYLSARLALAYTIPSTVSVKGLNAYGGGAGTRGTFYPAQQFDVDLGLEYSLTQRWALALDTVYSYSPKTRFKGVLGEGMPSGTTVQWSLAPALEYNWSDFWGVIAGCWFTVAGKNASAFQSGVIAVNYFQ